MNKKALLVTRVSGFVPQFEMNNVHILQEMGYEVHYAANFQDIVYGTDNARLTGSGIIRHHIPFGRSPFSLDTRRCYKQLKMLLMTEDFDLIHCHMPVTGVLTRKAAHKVYRKAVPVLYTAHGFHFFKGAPLANWMYYIPEHHYARYTDCLLLINEEDYERGKRFPVRGSVEHIPGTGLPPFPEPDPSFDIHARFGIPGSHKIVVTVGELTEEKNHAALIRAMDRFRRHNVTLLICGQGALMDHLRQIVDEMCLTHRVILAGYCDHIPDILRQADMFAFPSVREGLPVSVMEAMQAGLPVMAADIRGNHDLIEDGKGGFLFEENLTEDYIHGIRYFLDYPDEGIRMGHWNKKRVKAFGLDAVSARMREIYQGFQH